MTAKQKHQSAHHESASHGLVELGPQRRPDRSEDDELVPEGEVTEGRGGGAGLEVTWHVRLEGSGLDLWAGGGGPLPQHWHQLQLSYTAAKHVKREQECCFVLVWFLSVHSILIHKRLKKTKN